MIKTGKAWHEDAGLWRRRKKDEAGRSVQSADWKTEKHVPVIECPDEVRADETFEVRVSLGKEVAHPNTTEHHIRWIQRFFHPEGDKSSYHIGNFEFCAHGESVAAANEGPAHTHHAASAHLMVKKPGTIHALALCNIHALWESSRDIGIA